MASERLWEMALNLRVAHGLALGVFWRLFLSTGNANGAFPFVCSNQAALPALPVSEHEKPRWHRWDGDYCCHGDRRVSSSSSSSSQPPAVTEVESLESFNIQRDPFSFWSCGRTRPDFHNSSSKKRKLFSSHYPNFETTLPKTSPIL